MFVMKKQHVRLKYLAVFLSGTEGVKQHEFNGLMGNTVVRTQLFLFMQTACFQSVSSRK